MRLGPSGLKWRQALHLDVVLSAVGEVVFVEEALAGLEAEVGHPHSSQVVSEAHAADVGGAVLTSLNDEVVQGLVSPTQGELESAAGRLVPTPRCGASRSSERGWPAPKDG